MDIPESVETSEKHNGYYYSVKEALVIVILGSLCGLKMFDRYTSGQKARRQANF